MAHSIAHSILAFYASADKLFTEAALLPYALNKFTFETQLARRQFDKSVRPGKKQAVNKEGAYEPACSESGVCTKSEG